MVFNDTSSPITELIYVTTRRPLRPVTGRKFVTTRCLWCRSTCFFCNSSTMMSTTSSRQRAWLMLMRRVPLSHTTGRLTDWQGARQETGNTWWATFRRAISHYLSKISMVLGLCRQIVEAIDEEKFQALCARGGDGRKHPWKGTDRRRVQVHWLVWPEPYPWRHTANKKKKTKTTKSCATHYTLCSVLQNLPWVRHIFIIMPNERVRFLKPQEEIAEKSNVHQRQRFPRVRQRVFYRFFLV